MPDVLMEVFLPLTPLPEPFIEMFPIAGLPGDPIQIFGGGFTPGLPYRLLVADQLLVTGTVDPTGSIDTNFTVPPLPPYDYLVDLIDDAGLVQSVVLRVPGTNKVIDPGIDGWRTPDNGASSQDFNDLPIPPDFFGPGSDPFLGTIEFGGVPAGLTPPITAPVDTIVRRHAPLNLDGPGSIDTVPIEIVALSLQSVQPITVTYGGGSPELWEVQVNLASFHPQPLGTMTVTAGACGDSDGSFTATLPVLPRFVFTRQGDPEQRVLDFGQFGLPPIEFNTFNGHWVEQPPPSMGIPTLPDGLTVDHDGNPSTPPLGPLPGSSNFQPGVRAIYCEGCEQPPLFVKRLTREDAMLAAHGVLPPLPPGPDIDLDGIPDDCDNCPLTFNPLQEDLDDNGVGDICDLPPRIQIGELGGNVTLSWPAWLLCPELLSAPSLTPPVIWTPVLTPPAVVNFSNVVTLPAQNAERYFILAD